MHSVYVGRQPIFDREERIIGFELLFRGGHTTTAEVDDGQVATHELIHAAFVDIGIEHLVGDRLAFLNLPRAFLPNPILDALPPRQCALELLDDGELDPTLLESLRLLRHDGFRIVLSSACREPERPEDLRVADMIKLDVLGRSTTELRHCVARLTQPGRALIAAKIETEASFRTCLELGFQYFQGFYLSCPNVVEGQRMSGNQVALLRLLELLQQSGSSINAMADLVVQDAALSMQMLKLINSPRFRRARPVESIKQAMILIGRAELARWALLMSLRASGNAMHGIEQALIRARLAECLAAVFERADDADRFFTLGLLSVIDRVFGVPLVEILRQVRLGEEMRAALIDRAGPMAPVLDILDAFDQPDHPLPDHLTATPRALGQLYLEAIDWTGKQLAQLSG